MRSAPVVARRLPIEHELQSVGTLEFGAMLTRRAFVRELAGVLGTEVHLIRTVPARELAR